MIMDHGAAHSNAELIANLERAGVISNEAVGLALRLCPRDVFVPEAHKEEAFLDAPIRVEEEEFNISAPHMHATMIEALDVFPGASVMDVGSGCGLVAAACAVLAGREGHVLGIDVRRECCEMGRKGVAQLKETSSDFSSRAAPCDFECLNAFLLSGTAHTGRYDRIHVGASCPRDHLRLLIQLLKPEGGTMIVPVTPSDLRLIRKHPNGNIVQKVISQVRFSDLDVPGDAEVVLAAMRAERKARTVDIVPPSTYDEDMAAVIKADRWIKMRNPGLSTSPVGVITGLPQSPLAAGLPNTLIESLGDPDCALVKEGEWEVPTHSVLLSQRCDVLRARCNSGMADAELSQVAVPEHFSFPAVSTFVQYLYTDKLTCPPEQAAEVLHVAQYFGVPRCAQLCEHMLAKVLKTAQRSPHAVEGAAEAAASLLAMADDHGLTHLGAVALDFVVAHHDVVSKTEAYAALSKEQFAKVVQEACRQLTRVKAILEEVKESEQNGLPEPYD